MDLLAQLSFAANCILMGLASAGLWVWKQDRTERLKLLAELRKVESDFTASVAKVAEIHNQTAAQVTALADKVQAHGVVIAQQTGRQR